MKMAEGGSPFQLKSKVSSELKQAVSEIPKQKFDNKVPQPTLDDNRKRWLIVGICLHDVISPELRSYIEPIIQRLYNSLKSSDNIDTNNAPLPQYKTFNHKLDYKSINNNINLHKSLYDYRIRNHVDLSKSFLPVHMAKYTGFNQSCDSSALLGLIVNIRDPIYFPSTLRSLADKVRSDIRNKWAHCDFTEWDCRQFSSSFNLMENFVKELSLQTADKTRILGELKKWETCGMQFIEGSTLGLELVQDIYSHTKALAEYVNIFEKETEEAFEKVVNNMQQIVSDLASRIEKLAQEFGDVKNDVNTLKQQVNDGNEQMDVVLGSVKSLKLSHSDLECGHKSTTEDIKKLKTLNEDTVQWNIREQIKSTLENWKKSDDKFVETRASAHILNCIKTKNCVTATGNSGLGKTATVRHTSLVMAVEGYDVLPVTDPSDIINSYNPNQKQLYVVDDLCGKYSLNQTSFDKWSEKLPSIEPLLEHIKIIASCRLQVFKDEQFEDLKLFKSCECNLLSEQICLLDTEKDSIAETYLGTNAAKIKPYYDKFDFFPLLCHLCNENPNLDVVDFFQNPYSVYESELDKLKVKAYAKYCVLALCVMFNNRLEEGWLIEEVDKSINIVIKNTCEVCKLNRGTSKFLLKDELDSLLHTFLKKENNVYSVLHDKLFDFLSHYFGKMMITCLIKNASCRFISERFLFQSQADSYQYITIVPEKYHDMYIKRMIDDWSKGEVVCVFCNVNMKVRIFRQMFLSYVNKLDISKQRQLAHIVDTGKYSTTVLIQCCFEGYIDFIQWCLCHNVNVNQCRSNGCTPLYIACQEGYIGVVKLLLLNKADIDQCLNKGKSPLYISCCKRNVDIVEILLSNKANINKCDNEGCSPLYMACCKENVEIVKILLSNKADINKCDNYGWSPLYMACCKENVDIVEILLSNKADINKCNNNGWSPLYMACCNRNVEIVEILLSNKADINKCDNYGRSPLYMAFYKGNVEIVKILLSNKADINKCYNNGWSPLYMACFIGNVEIVKILLSNKADINKCINNERSPLYMACDKGNVEIVKILLSNKADINKCNNNGWSPLYMACDKGNVEIVEILLSNKADINKCDNNGWSPLYRACREGNVEIVKILLSNKADINKCDNNEWSPLYMACYKGNVEIVEILLSNKADINKCNNNERSPLFRACYRGNVEIVKILLSNKADINKCDNNEWSPLYMACYRGNVEIVKILLSNKADINKCDNNEWSPLYTACCIGNVEIVKILLSNKADINKCDNNEWSPLYTACCIGNVEIVKILLSNKADINKCDNDGCSPLYMACCTRNVEIVEILLSNKADINKCDNIGWSPLYMACCESNVEIVKILLSNKADINKCNNNGWSPLYMACFDGNVEIVKILLSNKADINISGSETSLVKMLSEKADTNKEADDGTAELAQKRNYKEIIKILQYKQT